MVIGVLKEIKGNEYRVAAVPATVHEIVRHGHTVYVETGAGVGSGFSDAQYEAAGAIDRKSTRLNSSHTRPSRMPSSA